MGFEVKDGNKLAPLYPQLNDWPIEMVAETFSFYCKRNNKDYRQSVNEAKPDQDFILFINKLAEI